MTEKEGFVIPSKKSSRENGAVFHLDARRPSNWRGQLAYARPRSDSFLARGKNSTASR